MAAEELTQGGRIQEEVLRARHATWQWGGAEGWLEWECQVSRCVRASENPEGSPSTGRKERKALSRIKVQSQADPTLTIREPRMALQQEAERARQPYSGGSIPDSAGTGGRRGHGEHGGPVLLPLVRQDAGQVAEAPASARLFHLVRRRRESPPREAASRRLLRLETLGAASMVTHVTHLKGSTAAFSQRPVQEVHQVP